MAVLACLYQREVVAGNPKVYGQLVQLLAPHTHVIGTVPAAEEEVAAAPEAAAAEPKTAVRVRKSGR